MEEEAWAFLMSIFKLRFKLESIFRCFKRRIYLFLKALVFHENKNKKEKTRLYALYSWSAMPVQCAVWRLQSGGQTSEERPGPDHDHRPGRGAGPGEGFCLKTECTSQRIIASETHTKSIIVHMYI